MERTVLLKIFPTRHEAEFAASRLDSEGIKSVIMADDYGGALSVQLSGGVRILVDPADLEMAQEILRE